MAQHRPQPCSLVLHSNLPKHLLNQLLQGNAGKQDKEKNREERKGTARKNERGSGVENPLTLLTICCMHTLGNLLTVPSTVGSGTAVSFKGSTALQHTHPSLQNDHFSHSKWWLKPGKIPMFSPNMSLRTQIYTSTASWISILTGKASPHKHGETWPVLHAADN